MKNISLLNNTGFAAVLIALLTLFGCVQEPVLWNKKSNEQVISDYIANHPDQYSEFGKLLEGAGLNSLLSVRGPYTLFLPDNAAMNRYYKEHNTSFEQFEIADMKILVYNHLVLNEISSGDFGLGAIRDTNAIGDYLVTEFQGSDVIINKKSKIIDRDIRVANGFIHQVEEVIEPVTITVYDQLQSDPAYSIFAKGLELTGLKAPLQDIMTVYGQKNGVDQKMRSRFTILAVPDKVFADSLGITNIDQLIAHFTPSRDSITYLSNAFYRYMEYHCLAGTYYLSDLTTKLYPILSSDNNVSVTVTDDYKLNLNKLTYTGFNIEQSNVPAKNGAIHSINNVLPVVQPEPTIFTFDTTDFPEIKQGDFYGKYYMKWFDGENTFPRIKWKGDYLQYYYKNHDAPTQLNWDCLNMLGFWEIEITTPKIMKGKYAVSGYVWANNIDFEVYLDGVKYNTVPRSGPDRAVWVDEITWTKTEEHKVKLINKTWGTLFWDTVIFTPVK